MTIARAEDGWPLDLARPPRGSDLPYDDGEPMESQDHRNQMYLLVELFTRAIGRSDVFVGGNQALYYSALQAKKNDFKAPDVFVVLDTIDNPDRLSWVVWEEDGRTPNVVIELLSPSTEANDRGPKRRIYERVLKVPDYFVYDPIDFRFEGWRLVEGVYQPLEEDEHGRLPCRELGIRLGRWVGPYLTRTRTWLRLFDAEGKLLPTYAEAEAARAHAESERAHAEFERANAEAERARAAEARVVELMAQLAQK